MDTNKKPTETFHAKRAIVIFSSRESKEILSLSVAAALTAAGDTPTILDIIINGNQVLAEEIKACITPMHFSEKAKRLIRLWFLPVADKAHAWNVYLHEICPFAEVVYFIDGYSQVTSNSLDSIANDLLSSEIALAATGVPTAGRQAKSLRKTMLRSGGMHGNLYAVRGTALKQLFQSGFKFPLGFYRMDALLRLIINYNLNFAKHPTNFNRILVCPEATWKFPFLKWWRMTDVLIGFKRSCRQAKGVLENRAIGYCYEDEKTPEGKLPKTSSELILSWIKNRPREAFICILRHPLCLLELQKMVRRKDWMQISTTKVVLVAEVRNCF